MTLIAFLAWEEQQTERHEFFGGETFAIAGGSAHHNRVTLNLASRIRDHLDGTSMLGFRRKHVNANGRWLAVPGRDDDLRQSRSR